MARRTDTASMLEKLLGGAATGASQGLMEIMGRPKEESVPEYDPSLPSTGEPESPFDDTLDEIGLPPSLLSQIKRIMGG